VDSILPNRKRVHAFHLTSTTPAKPDISDDEIEDGSEILPK